MRRMSGQSETHNLSQTVISISYALEAGRMPSNVGVQNRLGSCPPTVGTKTPPLPPTEPPIFVNHFKWKATGLRSDKHIERRR